MTEKNKAINPVVSFVVSILLWTALVLFAGLANLAGVLFLGPISLFKDKGSRNTIHLGSVWWAKSLIFLTSAWKLKVEGLENIDKSKHYLVVANHQSMIDILVVAASLNIPFKFLAKKELFKYPFVGWHMSFSGYIPVDRNAKNSRRKALLSLKDLLQRNVSVLFFPEGTRSVDGEILPFKPAGIKLASKAGVEILPVVIDGTGQALPKNSLFMKKTAKFTMSVGKPVDLTNVPNNEMPEAIEKMRADMVLKLKEIRER